ncbi:MAG: aa3-type cytochrome oxidase subunit IV [Pseudoclavibacter sp.]
MKSLERILTILALFFLVVTIAYTIWTTIDTGGPEWVGVVALFLMFLFSGFIAFYMWFERRPFRVKVLPEDRLDGEIDEAEQELGQFSPWSWWPIMLAACIGFVMFGMAVGAWPTFFIAPLLLLGIFGWSFEYYRGHLKH